MPIHVCQFYAIALAYKYCFPMFISEQISLKIII